MVIKANIAAWEISRTQLQPLESQLVGFGGKSIDALRKISLLVSFGD
jgi:hypothetical protein